MCLDYNAEACAALCTMKEEESHPNIAEIMTGITYIEQKDLDASACLSASKVTKGPDSCMNNRHVSAVRVQRLLHPIEIQDCLELTAPGALQALVSIYCMRMQMGRALLLAMHVVPSYHIAARKLY